MLIGGSALRFYALDRQSFWLDELFSRGAALAPTLAGTVDRGAINDMFPPIFPILTHWAVRLPGNAEVALRLPSALAGSAALFVVFLLGRCLHSARVGVIAAALLASHWFAVAYSQEARPYALLLLFSSLVAYCGLRVVARHRAGQPTRGALIALGLTGLTASYLHYIGLLFFAGSGLFLLTLSARRHAPIKGLLWTYAAVGMAYLPWLSIVLTQIERRVQEKSPPPVAAIARTYSDLCARHAPWFLLLLLAGWWAHRRRRESMPDAHSVFEPKDRLLLLTLWATLPVVITWTLSYLVVPIYTARNMIVILPALALLAALALVQLDAFFSRGAAVASVVAVAALVVDLTVLKGYYGAEKEPFRQFTQHVVEAAAQRQVALWVQPSRYARYVDQYLEVLGSELRVSSPDAAGLPTGKPEQLWILTRNAAPTPPPGRKVIETMIHMPDRRIPWAGKPMQLVGYLSSGR